MDSILDSIKKMLGIDPDDDAFDTDIIININSVFMVLNQIGVGPAECFSITSNTELWNDFMVDAINIAAIKSYIFLKVKVLFDPPAGSVVLDAMLSQISELEWRLNRQAEEGLYDIEEEEDEEDE